VNCELFDVSIDLRALIYARWPFRLKHWTPPLLMMALKTFPNSYFGLSSDWR
jgi:hypothetical protein